MEVLCLEGGVCLELQPALGGYDHQTAGDVPDAGAADVELCAVLNDPLDGTELDALLVVLVEGLPADVTAVGGKVDELVVRLGNLLGVLDHQVAFLQVGQHLAHRLALRTLLAPALHWRPRAGPAVPYCTVHLADSSSQQVTDSADALSRFGRHALAHYCWMYANTIVITTHHAHLNLQAVGNLLSRYAVPATLGAAQGLGMLRRLQ